MTAWFGIIIIIVLGWGTIHLAGIKTVRLESIALGWLIGSFLVSTFLFWVGWAGAWSLLMIAILLMTVFFVRKLQQATDILSPMPLNEPSSNTSSHALLIKAFEVFIWMLIIFQLVYALFTVQWLTTQYWDSFHFWHLRAKYFFFERSLGLQDEPYWMLGAEKIHYPIHLPLLKALICALAGGWSENWVLGIDIINYTAFLIIVYLFVRQISSSFIAVITLYLITSLPLISIHLSAGFGDLTVAIYLVSAVIFWEKWRRWGDMKNLSLSGFLLAVTAWTKNDPIAIFFPIFLLATFLAGKWQAIKICLPALLLPLLPWFIFKWKMGLGYNPRPTEDLIQFHPEALPFMAKVLVDTGGFSILWGFLIFLLLWRCKPHLSKALWPFAWGCIIMVFSVFIFTQNFKYLMLGTTFSRSLLQATPLLIIALVLRVVDIISEEKKPIKVPRSRTERNLQRRV